MWSNPGQARDPEEGCDMTNRVQLALNVSDLEAAVTFYGKLFGTEPATRRPGYANFAIADPPLELVLFEDPSAASALNRLGVELTSAEAVAEAAERFAVAGLGHHSMTADRCCHAVQDKVWVDAPDVPLDGWEFYVVLADDPTQAEDAPASACCGATATSSMCCSGTGER
jgi:catechol 2,3-dioxygenase-like lactoylglutathione lyase family enzyme